MSRFRAERVIYPEINSPSQKVSIRAQEEPTVTIRDDKLFVAVGTDFKDNKLIVIWALQNSGRKKLSILHVHTPAKLIPVLGGKFPVSQVGKEEVVAYHEQERMEMHKALDEYIQLCAVAGITAEKLVGESDSVEEGIIRLISENRIERLVMGAAADSRYKKNMIELKSKKAIYVGLKAPMFCDIWFICKGYLIKKRSGVKPQYPNDETGESKSLKSRSVIAVSVSNSDTDVDKYKSRSVGIGGIIRDTDDWPTLRMMYESGHPSSSDEGIRDSPLPRSPYTGQRGSPLACRMSPVDEKSVGSSSPPHLLQESRMNDDLYDQLDTLLKEADSSRKEAYIESTRRQKAEMEWVDAMRKAKRIETLYYEEQKRRKELEEMLANKEELETIKTQHAKALEELQTVLCQNSFLEREIEKLNLVVKELEEYKTERDEIERERDNALAEADRLRRQHAPLDPTSTQISCFFADFTFSEIAEATDNFNLMRIIGEGGFGKTYKGLLRHTEVAIKVLNPNGVQGPREFNLEVAALSKLRHPNIVTLIGVCREASAIIYEYLPNGSLEDRLSCKNNTPSLPWEARIQIVVELCSVLMFLHSSQPESIVHSDLKPDNVLLDARFCCKLSDFGICQTISDSKNTITDLKGTFGYMDPDFVSTGELTPKYDVYAFGIIILRLLTNKSAIGITREVQYAMDSGDLGAVLDPSAGEWPLSQAQQLALLALGCSEMQRESRPDLVADVWKVLQPMRISR